VYYKFIENVVRIHDCDSKMGVNMKYLMSIIAVLILFSATESSAQNEQVRLSLKMVALGQEQDVKVQLPDLLAQYPEDPGVMLLHAVVLQDTERALGKYKTIVKIYPSSDWADDASMHIVQFYAMAGDTIMAKRELNNYRNNYPTSQLLAPAADAVRLAVSFARMGNVKTKTLQVIPITEPVPVLTEIPVEVRGKTVSPQDPPVITLSETSPKIEPVVNTTSIQVQTKEADDDEIIDVVEIAEDDVVTETIVNVQNTEPVKRVIPEDENTNYGLQVGIYSTYEAAKFEQDKFRKQRMLATVEKKRIDGETMFAVVIGNYSSQESAETAKIVVQQQCKCLPIVFIK
jgi:uncharacterized protein with GYD domain